MQKMSQRRERAEEWMQSIRVAGNKIIAGKHDI